MPPPTKKEVARALLQDRSIRVHLDPRRPGVVVPTPMRRLSHVVLEFGFAMPVPIPDLMVATNSISGTLYFRKLGGFFTCYVPWEAVFAIVDADRFGKAWREDAPPHLRKKFPVSLRLVK